MKQIGRCAVSAFACCDVLLFGGELLESLLEGACSAFSKGFFYRFLQKREVNFMKYDPKDLTADEKRELVAQIKKKNPEISDRKIAEMTGISRSHVWGIIHNLKPDSYPHFDTEADLESWIKDNPVIVFNEEIKWLGSQVRLDKGMAPDLVGVDSKGNLFIVEVKLGRPDRDSVAQILDYASYLTDLPNTDDMMAHALNVFFSNDGLDKELCLFVVGELISQSVERICQYLRVNGINIQHLSVGDSIESDES